MGKMKWTGAELNRRHTAFQAVALPTELPVQRWSVTRREPGREGPCLGLLECQELAAIGAEDTQTLHFGEALRRLGHRFPRATGQIHLSHRLESGLTQKN